MENPTRFIWFWTFWHWSRESCRVGALSHDSLYRFSGNWDAWFHHEASDQDLLAIAGIGRDQELQGQFVTWIFQRWSRQADLTGNRTLARFVITQLARVAPFDRWADFEKYRKDYGAQGVSAIILPQGSHGEAEDVHTVEALLLPDFGEGAAAKIGFEGFHADEKELAVSQQAVVNLLGGRSLSMLLAIWIFTGHRPYRRWLKKTIAAGWLTLAIIIALLRFGPEPGAQLAPLVGFASFLWGALVLFALTSLVSESFHLWREGRQWRGLLSQSKVWLRMDHELTLRGGSAGLPFSLNILLSLRRAYRTNKSRSWVWRNIFARLLTDSPSWAATGVITPHGRVNAVVLEPKLRACAQKPAIRHILTPKQRDAKSENLKRVDLALQRVKPTPRRSFSLRLGYAAGYSALRLHPCSHLTRAVMSLSRLTSAVHIALLPVTFAVTLALAIASHDMWCILRPPEAPLAIAASSPSPAFLRIGLQTAQPNYFKVLLESEYWVNRRAPVGPPGSPFDFPYAEIPLVRAARPTTGDADTDEGTVWVERRRLFLGREFQFGERVGRYSVSEFSRLHK